MSIKAGDKVVVYRKVKSYPLWGDAHDASVGKEFTVDRGPFKGFLSGQKICVMEGGDLSMPFSCLKKVR